MNNEILKNLWDCTKGENSSEVWKEIINELTNKLALFLNCEIQPDANPFIEESADSPSFCAEIKLYFMKSGPIDLKAKGTLGMQIVEGENGEDEINVDVYLFLFEGVNKLRAYDKSDFIRCVFNKIDSDDGAWEKSGWLEDEWDEFEGVRWE